jgi:hypothetical protein
VTDQPAKHGHQHGPEGPDPIRYANYHCIVRGPRQRILVRSPAFVFTVTRHMHVYRLIDVEAGLVVAGASDVEIMVRNETAGRDMLTGALVIPAGDLFTPLDAETDPSPVELDDDGLVEHGDRLYLNVEATAADARGLEIILVFV